MLIHKAPILDERTISMGMLQPKSHTEWAFVFVQWRLFESQWWRMAAVPRCVYSMLVVLLCNPNCGKRKPAPRDHEIMDKSVYKAASVELMLIWNNRSGQLEGFDLRANLFPRNPSPVSPQNWCQIPMNSEYVSVPEASQKTELWPT